MRNKPQPRTSYAQYAIRELFLVAERIEKAGGKIAKVNIGDPVPYFGTPKYIVDAHCRALKQGKTCYGRSPGEMPFIEAIAERHKRMYGVEYPMERIFATQGASEAIAFLNICLMGRGSGALLFRPFYPTYAPMVKIYGGRPFFCPCVEEKGWAPDFGGMEAQLRKAKREGIALKYILAINPCNPTGALWERAQLKRIARFADENGLLLVSDEIYDQLVFGNEKFVSMSQVAKRQPHVVLNGLSKNWCATGLRIGWMLLGGEEKEVGQLADAVMRLGTLRLCPNVPAQYAGIEALGNVKAHKKFLSKFVPEVKRRSDRCWKALNETPGVSCQRARGAFYLFPKIDIAKAGCRTDKEFVRKLLENEKVWAVHGSGFGLGGHIRMVTLPEEKVLDSACEGIARMMRNGK